MFSPKCFQPVAMLSVRDKILEKKRLKDLKTANVQTHYVKRVRTISGAFRADRVCLQGIQCSKFVKIAILE